MKQLTDTTVIVGPVRLSYMNVFQARKNDLRNGTMEYSAMLLFPKAPNQFQADGKAEGEAVFTFLKALINSRFPNIAKWECPFKDGDKETNNEGQPKFPGYWYLSARCDVDYPPVLIDGSKNPVNGGWASGDWGKVKLNFYVYDYQGKKGVGSGLRAIQFLFKDEPLGASNDPETVKNEFDAEEGHELAGVGAGNDYDPFA